MPERLEALLSDLTKEVRTNTEAYIRMELLAQGLREDFSELRELVSALATTQASHAERLTVVESRVIELNHLVRDVAELRVSRRGAEAEMAAMQNQIAANAPVKTPWTAIVSAVVALSALLWTLFGR